MKYRQEIDGLRAIAVLPVILFHAGIPMFGGGFVGVDVFFVISGFLVSGIVMRELDSESFSIIDFYERRARRIMPALLAMIIVSTAVAMILLRPGELVEFTNSIISTLLFYSNIFFWQTSGYFDTAAELKPLLHTWSLSVEEQYYVIFPLALVLIKRLNKKYVNPALVIALICSLALAHWGSTNKPLGSFYLLPTRAWELLAGALAAVYCTYPSSSGNTKLKSEVMSLLGLALILGSIFLYSRSTPFPSLYTTAPVLGTTLVLIFANKDNLAGRLLSRAPLTGIGLISYSAYLWHQPIFAFFRVQSGGHASPEVLAALTLPVLFLAYISWRFIEGPFRDRSRLNRAQVFRVTGAVSFGLIAFATASFASTGFLFRYPAQDRYLAGLRNSEAGSYVAHRFLSLKGKEYVNADPRRKIVVVGDSYAEDIVNAVFESPLKDSVQLSTFHISHLCGNLFIPRKEFAREIRPEDANRCGRTGLYENEQLRVAMSRADEVWFASAWLPWQAHLVKLSIANVQKETGRKVLVFGSKNFGSIMISDLLLLKGRDRTEYESTTDSEMREANARLEAGIDDEIFIDVQSLMCKPKSVRCRIFTEAGELISYDGGHLTPAGAKLLGEKLTTHPSLAHIARNHLTK